MSMFNIQVGDVVPIGLTLGDGAINQYPQAIIRDNDDNLLNTLDLNFVASGNYKPVIPYVMPDEAYLMVSYIVYSDSGHTVINEVYEYDLDIFYQIFPDEFKANTTGLAPAHEYDAALGSIYAEVENLNGEPMRGTDGANIVVPPTTGQIEVALAAIHGATSWLTGSGGMTEAEMHTALDSYANKTGYKADVTNLDAAVSTRSSHSVADVWTYTTRTLTSFGTLIADMWTAVTRTLTVGTKDVEIDAIKVKTDQMDFIAGDIKATLDGEEVVTDTASRDASKADISALAIEANVEGHVTTSLNLYNGPTRVELTADKDEIIAEVNENEVKIDTLVSSLSFQEKIIKNKRHLLKTGSVWELIIYDDDDITPILQKDLKDKDGNDINDLLTGSLSEELQTSV